MRHPQQGETIGHYTLLEEVGQGSMGLVFKARDNRLQRIVALKFIPSEDDADDSVRLRFLQEARTASKINHPNVCTIYTIDEVEDTPYIVMEFVEGRTLRAVIDQIAKSGELLSLPTLFAYASEMAAGICSAHDLEIVHRDVKSENVMLRKSGRLCVMDFGLARIESTRRLTLNSSLVGTIGYMAPEVLQGNDPDRRCDIFSFGVLLYELLTGALPFRGAHEAAMIYSVVNEDPTPVERYRPDVPAELESFIARLLAKDPTERVQEMKEVLEELNRLQHSLENGDVDTQGTPQGTPQGTADARRVSTRPGTDAPPHNTTSLRRWHQPASGLRNELRLFVSSTFVDLEEERNLLARKVFPEIRAICRERGITFTEIDLRWGAAHKTGNYSAVLRTCLDEIDRCRPWFISILGDRYGSIPSYLDVQRDPEILRIFPWVEEAALEGMSIVDMEITYAALQENTPSDHALFYARSTRHRRDRAAGADNEKQLEDLKGRIESAGFSVVNYRDPVALSERIFNDLLEMIDRDFADTIPPTPLTLERRRHEAYAINRRRGYVARPDLLRLLNDHIFSSDPPLVLAGESGSGKSALLAYWGDGFGRRHGDTTLIEHYIGLGEGGVDHHGVMRHICMELCERFGWEKEIPSDPSDLERTFGEWMIEAGNDLAQKEERLVLVVDGVNQLGAAGRLLRWIPEVLPSSIRMIVTTTDEQQAEDRRDRGWREIRIDRLSAEEREAITIRFLGDYQKGLKSEQVTAIAEAKATAHPLFLKTLLEEIRVIGTPEEVDRRLEHYLGADDTADLFQLILDRIEEEFETLPVSLFFTSLWGSESGLESRELTEITGLSRLRVEEMIASLDYHLSEQNNRLQIAHSFLREGIEKRFLLGDDRKRELHGRLADFFITAIEREYGPDGEPTVRDARELCEQLRRGGETGRLVKTLSRLPILSALITGGLAYDLLTWWNSVGEVADMVEEYTRELASLRADGIDKDRVVTYMEQVGGLFLLASRYDGASPLLHTIYRYHRLKEGPEGVSTVRSMESLAETLYHQGQFDRAKELWECALERVERREGVESPALCPILDSLMTVAHRKNNSTGMEEYCGRSLAISEKAYGKDDPRSIDRLKNLGSLQMVQKKFEEAAETYKEVVLLSEKVWGTEHFETAVNSEKYAHALAKLGRLDESIEILTRSAEQVERGMGATLKLGRVFETLGYVYLWKDDPQSAENCFRRALEIRTRLLVEDHPDTFNIQVILATSLRRQEEFDDAEIILRQVIPTILNAQGEGSILVKNAAEGLARILESTGREEEAWEWDRLRRVPKGGPIDSSLQ